MTKKIHITLKEELIDNPAEMEKTITHIKSITGPQKINEKRLKRYGIFTCKVEPKQIKELQKIEAIENISDDEERKVT